MAVPARERTGTTLLAALVAGVVVSTALGVYAREHTPTGEAITTFGFDSMIAMKVWLSVAVGVLAVGQLIGALWLYGRLGIPAPRWLGNGHRASGVLTVALSLPVAWHCLWSLGYQTYDTRVMLHSLAGCLLYGAFVAKVIAVRGRGPVWLLPIAGGLLFTLFVVVVLTSAGWYLDEVGVPSGSGY